MKKIIKIVYQEYLESNESNCNNSEYQNLMKKLCDNESKFINSLSSKQKEKFVQFLDSMDEVENLEFEKLFTDGFKAGAKFMLESFNKNA